MSRENSLVTTQWVEDNLDNDQIVLIEVDEDTTSYDKGHIRGAVKLDWRTDLQDGVRHDFIGKDRLEALLSSKGIANDDTVVFYGGNNNWFAAYAYWYFKLYGHQNVKLLDGGRKKWEAESRALNNRAPDYAATTYRVGQTNTALRARLGDALAAAEGKSGTQLIDIRSADEYQGKVFAPAGVPELSIRAGHIPGAVNVPWGKAVNEDGTFKSKADLQKLYADVGVDGSKPIITYCRIGERSSHTWFALSKILGYQVKNYDGSWTEYGNSVGVPINNPAGTIWAAK